MYREDYDEYINAIQEWKEIIRNEPDNDHAYFMLGTIYQDIEKYGKALTCFKKAEELNPDKKIYNHYIAQVKQAQGKLPLDEAVDLMKKSGIFDEDLFN